MACGAKLMVKDGFKQQQVGFGQGSGKWKACSLQLFHTWHVLKACLCSWPSNGPAIFQFGAGRCSPKNMKLLWPCWRNALLKFTLAHGAKF